MYKIEIVNKKTKEIFTFSNVEDKNNGEKLYYKFEIDATTLVDGEYTINVYNDDDVMVCSDTLNVGEFNTNKLQYERGNNIYISTNLDVTTEDKYVTLTSIELTVKPTSGINAMTSVTINAQPIYNTAYNNGYENGTNDGYNDGYTKGTTDGYNNGYENGTNDGYNEGVREQKSKLTSIDITRNGTYTTEDGYNNVSVNVQSDSYSYKVNTVDEDGLRQLGWDAESINYFKDNTLHYATQNDEYVVSEENLALKDIIISSQSVQNNKDNQNLKFLPKFTYYDSSGYVNFENCKYIKAIPLKLFNFKIKNLSFNGCYSLQSIPPIDTSSLTNMTYLFNNCHSLISIPPLNTSNVTKMQGTFSYCYSLLSIPLIDTSKVDTMYGLFQFCYSLQSIPQLNTSNVTNMKYMFGHSGVSTIPQLDTSNVITMENMFNTCGKLITIPPLNTSNVTNMNSMFYDCQNLQIIPQLDTSKVTNVNYLFYSCNSLTSLPLLDFGSVTTINTFFGYADMNNLTDLGGFKDLKIDWKDSYGLSKLPNLTYQSVLNVINNLYDFRGNGDTTTTKTIKFNTNSLALLSDDDKAIATAKGWVLTS